MADHPSAEDAAAALRDVDRRTDQALDARRHARWVYVLFGVLLFGFSASHDFAPEWASTWSNLLLAVLVLGYFVLLRTRRGAALLGQPAQVPMNTVSARFRIVAALVIVVLAVGVAVLGSSLSVPYFSTGLGAVLAIALIVFGPQLQTALNRASKRR